MTQQTGNWSREQNSAVTDLAVLVGEWAMVGKHPAYPSEVKGQSSFHWLEEEALLVWHSHWEQPGPPSSVSVIGHDDSGAAEYTILSSDERGTSRIYYMSLEGHVWIMHRESPGFSQRMTGAISDDGRTITVQGELSRD